MFSKNENNYTIKDTILDMTITFFSKTRASREPVTLPLKMFTRNNILITKKKKEKKLLSLDWGESVLSIIMIMCEYNACGPTEKLMKVHPQPRQRSHPVKGVLHLLPKISMWPIPASRLWPKKVENGYSSWYKHAINKFLIDNSASCSS